MPAAPECVFCQIVRQEKEAYVVLDDEHCVAFLDYRPLFPGHCLVIPRAHHETLAELPAASIEPLFKDARVLSAAVEQAMAADGSFVAINNRVSQSVPHLHVHVVPRRKGDGLRGFFWPRKPYEGPEVTAEVQRRVREAVAALRGREERA
jgi:histidine triad (HIT) family protein